MPVCELIGPINSFSTFRRQTKGKSWRRLIRDLLPPSSPQRAPRIQEAERNKLPSRDGESLGLRLLGIISAGDQTGPRPETISGQEICLVSHESLLSKHLTSCSRIAIVCPCSIIKCSSQSSASAVGASDSSRIDVDDEALPWYQSE